MLYESSDSFLEETVDFDSAKYVVIPSPLDMTTTYLKGTKFGPRSVIEASRSLENYDVELGYELRDKIFTLGELELPPDINMSLESIRLTVSDVLLKGKFPIILGGEHTCGYGASMAFEDDVAFVIFDAHADFKKDVLGVSINHASNSRLINKKKEIALIGVRSLSLDDEKDLKKSKISAVYARELDDEAKISRLVSSLNGKKAYISVDMDVFDPSLAPGVGTPQPGGMDYRQFLSILRKISEVSKLVGMDVVEVRPMDDNKITEILAAKIIMDVIALNELRKR